jgi:hypothetical protein
MLRERGQTEVVQEGKTMTQTNQITHQTLVIFAAGLVVWVAMIAALSVF